MSTRYLIGYPAGFRIRSKKDAKEFIEEIMPLDSDVDFFDVHSLDPVTKKPLKRYRISKEQSGTVYMGHGWFGKMGSIWAPPPILDDKNIVNKLYKARKSFNAYLKSKGV